MNLDGLVMGVTTTADQGMVGTDTRLSFRQQGTRVFGRYGGSRVVRGRLVGRLTGSRLRFRYVQVELSGEIHGGHSLCDVMHLADGRIRILEHFKWRTRAGSGTNVFDEVVGGEAE